jgi:hypothetical protein
MNGEAFFGGPSGADCEGGRGRPVATRGCADVRVSASCVIKLMQRYRETGVRACELLRPDVADARAGLRKDQETLDPRRLVFIDETLCLDQHDAPLWPL